jgi:hypothetical protein
MGGSGYVRLMYLECLRTSTKNIILDRLPSARGLDVNAQNVHSYALKCVVQY